ARDDGRIPTSATGATTRIVVVGRLFVVLLLDVHAPHVVLRAGGDVLGREHRRVHRVVLVVVPVHPVATDGMDVGGAVLQPFDDARNVGLVVLVVERIRLGHAHHVADIDLARVGQSEDLEVVLALVDDH